MATWLAAQQGRNLNTFAGQSGISQFYRFFIPAQQFIGSGDAKDKSGNSADATRLASLTDAAVWLTLGYVTSGVGANAGPSIPVAKFSLTLVSAAIFSARIKKAGPSWSRINFRCADAATAQGFYISMRAASSSVSKVRPILNTSGGVVSGLLIRWLFERGSSDRSRFDASN